MKKLTGVILTFAAACTPYLIEGGRGLERVDPHWGEDERVLVCERPDAPQYLNRNDPVASEVNLREQGAFQNQHRSYLQCREQALKTREMSVSQQYELPPITPNEKVLQQQSEYLATEASNE